MKKILLGALLLAGITSGNAQMADGTPAPNFTVTDINGNSHTLTDYLSAGKTVILDFSATWCGPCWNYHNTHALADLYNSYGPNGSDEVMVFYIEADAATTLANLNGIGANTQGNWVEGTPYPIVDNAALGSTYQIGYYPTIYRICPDGLVYEINQLSAANLRNDINSACSTTLGGVTNHGGAIGSEVAMCSTTGVPTAKIKNYGTNNITSGTMILKEDGVQVATTPFTGSVAQWATGNVSFASMPLSTTANYTVELTAINGGATFNTILTEDDMSVVSANASGFDITVKFFTDNYPAESTWEIRNSSTNAVVASGGPYIGAGGTSAGGPDALKTKTHDVTLPAGNNCYKIMVYDTYGDGLVYGTNPAGQFGIEIVSNSATVINLDLGNFGSTLTRDAALKTDATSGIDQVDNGVFTVYPNPATDVVNVSFDAVSGDYAVALYDLQGRIVVSQNYSVTTGTQILSVPVSDIVAGSYIISITGNGTSKKQSVVIR